MAGVHWFVSRLVYRPMRVMVSRLMGCWFMRPGFVSMVAVSMVAVAGFPVEVRVVLHLEVLVALRLVIQLVILLLQVRESSPMFVFG